jgi:hypothetical protein
MDGYFSGFFLDTFKGFLKEADSVTNLNVSLSSCIYPPGPGVFYASLIKLTIAKSRNLFSDEINVPFLSFFKYSAIEYCPGPGPFSPFLIFLFSVELKGTFFFLCSIFY